MCWVSKTIPIKNIAEKDIICYKIFHIQNIILDKWKIQKLYSEYMNFLYIPYKEQVYINLKIENNISDKIITFGYHSYSTIERAIDEIYNNSKYYTIVECIIPKDSEYYINSCQEIVSSNIIVTDKMFCF